jgi:hypothetical protein
VKFPSGFPCPDPPTPSHPAGAPPTSHLQLPGDDVSSGGWTSKDGIAKAQRTSCQKGETWNGQRCRSLKKAVPSPVRLVITLVLLVKFVRCFCASNNHFLLMSLKMTMRSLKLPSLGFAAGAAAFVPALVFGTANVAQAASTDWTPNPVPGSPYTTLTKRYTNFDAFDLTWSPWIGDKRVKLTSVGSSIANDQFSFKFNPANSSWETVYDRGAPVSGANGAYSYIIEIDPTKNGAGVCTTFSTLCGGSFSSPVSIALTPVGGDSPPRNMTKTISEVTAGDGKGATIASNFADDSTANTATLPIPSGLTRLWVDVTWSRGIGAGRGITGMTDSYMQIPVPGPLPILGAGAAFGMSRRLRQRIRSSRA